MSPVRLRLAELRGDLSQGALARKAGVRRATISEIEAGKATRVSLDVVEKLALALGVEPGELFEREGKRKRSPR